MIERLFDITQETGANDTTATPHKGDATVVEIPAILFGGFHHQVVALCVRDDLGTIKCFFKVIDKLLFISFEIGPLPGDRFRSFYPQLFLCRETA